MEKHHIIPKHDKGTDDPSNIILLTVKEHVIAHWIRWKALNQISDYISFLFRIGDTEEAVEKRIELVKQARERDKIEKHFFFDPDFQREMVIRGGAKGGLANTDAQFLARQQVGQTCGRQTGKGNQGETLRNFLTHFVIWRYKGKTLQPKNVKDWCEELFVCISPKETFKEVTDSLNAFVPNSIRNSTSMHKVIYGQRPKMYGWKIVNMLTRSEVREGLQEFQTQNPDKILYYEEMFRINEGFE
jgi:hypothetical protein